LIKVECLGRQPPPQINGKSTATDPRHPAFGYSLGTFNLKFLTNGALGDKYKTL